MKKVLIYLLCSGSMLFAQLPFITVGAGVVGDKETKVEFVMGSDFNKDGVAGMELNLHYGIGGRFHIGANNAFIINKKSGDSENITGREARGFKNPVLELQFSLIPDILAAKVIAQIGGSNIFGGDLIGSWNLKNAGTEFNLNLGYRAMDYNGKYPNADFDQGYFYEHPYEDRNNNLAWAYSVVQPINNWFLGAEIYGLVFQKMRRLGERGMFTQWQFGGGHNFEKHPFSIALGLGGDFYSNGALEVVLGLTYTFGKK